MMSEWSCSPLRRPPIVVPARTIRAGLLSGHAPFSIRHIGVARVPLHSYDKLIGSRGGGGGGGGRNNVAGSLFKNDATAAADDKFSAGH